MTRAARRAARGDGGGIHRLRVSTRRLREALGVVPDSETTRELRRLGKSLGPVRELDVARKILAKSAERESWPAAVVSRVDEWCANARERAFADARAVLDDIEPKDLSSRLNVLAATADARLQPAPGYLRATAKALVDAIDEAGTVYAPRALHEIRIAAKKLRYGMEISPAGESEPGALRQLRGVQTVLGSMHDLQVLQQFIQQVAAEARDLGEMATLGSMARTIEATCRGWHAKALRLLPAVRALAAGLAVRPRDAVRPARMTGAARAERARRRIA